MGTHEASREEDRMSALESSSRITPFFWFNQNAEEAVDFYLSVFPNSRRLHELRSPSQTTVAEGKTLLIDFELDGQKFTALNGGPADTFNKSISFSVRCDSQQEIDTYWAKLSEGGTEIQCGWLQDRFGLAWQIVPARIAELVSHPKAMQAMMSMIKLDIAALERAAAS
jgi:predicted 3-demethylubiquinone-9 3-methyltransferase (glyoxalase superfamily)